MTDSFEYRHAMAWVESGCAPVASDRVAILAPLYAEWAATSETAREYADMGHSRCFPLFLDECAAKVEAALTEADLFASFDA